MKILYTSDIHVHREHLFTMLSVAEAEEVNCIIVGGDLVSHHVYDHNTNFVKAQADYLTLIFIPAIIEFKAKNDIDIFLDLGNDDWKYNRPILEAHDGDLFHLLHFRKHRLTDAVDIIGYMSVPPTPFRIKDWEKPDAKEHYYAPGNAVKVDGLVSTTGRLEEIMLDLDSDDTIESDLEELSKLVEKPFLFVSHTPPYQTPLDIIFSGQHVGSLSIRKFIEKWSRAGKLLGSFHGHIHESPQRSNAIQTMIHDAMCFNPGQDSRKDNFQYLVFSLIDTEIIL